MLYLFGQLALSDSLFYHESAGDDCPAAVAPTPPVKAEASARPAETGSRLREHHLAPVERPACSRPS